MHQRRVAGQDAFSDTQNTYCVASRSGFAPTDRPLADDERLVDLAGLASL